MQGLMKRYNEAIVIVGGTSFGRRFFSFLSYEGLSNRPARSRLDIWSNWGSPSYLAIAKNGYRKFGDKM
jgi:hypothetical protein